MLKEWSIGLNNAQYQVIPNHFEIKITIFRRKFMCSILLLVVYLCVRICYSIVAVYLHEFCVYIYSCYSMVVVYECVHICSSIVFFIVYTSVPLWVYFNVYTSFILSLLCFGVYTVVILWLLCIIGCTSLFLFVKCVHSCNSSLLWLNMYKSVLLCLLC